MTVPSIQAMESRKKSQLISIPIIKTVRLLYIPTGTHVQALVASKEFADKPEGELVYVECGSQHGHLNLVEIPKEIPGNSCLPQRINYYDGTYDRDSITREITNIYLDQKYVYDSAYFGSLEELTRTNPNIELRK